MALKEGLMRNLLLLVAFLFSTHIAEVQAQSSESVEGVYERVSLTNITTGEEAEAANRRGLLIMAHGYYSMMTMRPDRQKLEPGQKRTDMSEPDQIAFLEQWLDINAHCGPLEVEEDTLVWHRDISEDPKEVDTVSRLKYEMRGDQLVIKFGLPNGNQYEWVWRKLR
jgi:hypothetical protein